MAEKYFTAVGRRKTSIANIKLFNVSGENQINEKPLKKVYFHLHELRKLESVFKATDLSPKDFYFTSKIKGGGKESQLEALRLAIARAIVKFSPERKKALKDEGLLTRDPRMVERKKAGHRKARKSEQYSKR